VPALVLAEVVLLVTAHRAQWKPDWINVAAHLALAALLFWYVLETWRVANETRRLALQSEA
jgi:threonine/homoserine efflux transporter RhtA